jgi:hemolysin-activating ACP:hemolysin acyltransferase
MRVSKTAPFRLPYTPGAALFTGPPTPSRVQEAFPLGIAASLLVDTDRKTLSIASLLAWLAMPINLGQILFLTSWERQPLGFATWAYVTPRTLGRLASGEQDLPSQEEWNEGAELWLVDIVAPFGHAAELVRHLRAQLGVRHDTAHFRRRTYRRRRFTPASVPQLGHWGSEAQADLMFDQTGHVPSTPFDRGWIAPDGGFEAGLHLFPEQARAG